MITALFPNAIETDTKWVGLEHASSSNWCIRGCRLVIQGAGRRRFDTWNVVRYNFDESRWTELTIAVGDLVENNPQSW
jgi:hypothetical protein